MVGKKKTSAAAKNSFDVPWKWVRKLPYPPITLRWENGAVRSVTGAATHSTSRTPVYPSGRPDRRRRPFLQVPT